MKLFQNRVLINSFAIVGVFSIIIFLTFLTYIGYIVTIGNKEQINNASKNDVRFILNWCELGDDKIDKVLNSYVAETGFSSDHHETYLIKIKNFKISDLKNTQTGKWYRGDQLSEILRDAVKFVVIFSDKTPWFIQESQIFKDDCFVYPRYIGTNGLSPNSVELIILKPKLNLIYYISVSI